MRAWPTVLALWLLAMPAVTQDIPSGDSLAEAEAACRTELDPACLIALAKGTLAEEIGRPDFAVAYIVGAQIALGDRAGAERTLAGGPPSPEALLALGRGGEAYDLAREAFPRIIVEEGSAEGSFREHLIRAQLAHGQIDLALDTMRGTEGFPEARGARRLVTAWLVAEGDFARVEALMAEHPSADLRLWILSRRAETALAEGRIAEAAEAAMAMGITPDALDLLTRIGTASALAGDRDSARRAYRSAFDALASGERQPPEVSQLVTLAYRQAQSGFAEEARESALLARGIALAHVGLDPETGLRSTEPARMTPGRSWSKTYLGVALGEVAAALARTGAAEDIEALSSLAEALIAEEGVSVDAFR